MKYTIKKVMIIAAVAFSINAGAQQTAQDGIKMYNYKKFQSAERILEPLAATDARANYYLGLTYLEEGKTDKALGAFSKFPEDPANISGTAQVAFAQKDYTKGMKILNDLAAKSKKKEWVQEKYAADAITYSQGTDYHQAVTWYKDALTKADEVETHINLGDAYRKISGGGGDAMSNYETATEKDPKNSLGFTRIGDLWYEAHNYESALMNYDKAKNADNVNPLPYLALGNAYTFSGKYKIALENYQQYYNLSDKTLADKLIFARAQFRAQSFCDAAKFAQDLMNDPGLMGNDKTEVIGVLGFSQAHCGDSLEALKNMRTYFRIKDPAKITPTDYIEFGKLFLKLEMFDSAGYYYTKGIEGDTARNKTDIYRTIAEAFRLKKDFCKSADWYDKIIKSNPETQPLDYFWRGYMYYYCKDLNKSVKSFEEFEAKYPDEPSAMYWHARALAYVDSEASTCVASPYFIKWLEKVGPDYQKKNDMKIAYEYLLLCAYNKKDKENMKVYMDKIRAIDPADTVLKQVEEAEKPAPQRKAAPAKGKK
jgi:tetratricopeptide (TPR) repeat protein